MSSFRTVAALLVGAASCVLAEVPTLYGGQDISIKPIAGDVYVEFGTAAAGAKCGMWGGSEAETCAKGLVCADDAPKRRLLQGPEIQLTSAMPDMIKSSPDAYYANGPRGICVEPKVVSRGSVCDGHVTVCDKADVCHFTEAGVFCTELKIVAEGQTCDYSTLICDKGFACHFDYPATPTCQKITTILAGGMCSYPLNICADGLYCASDMCKVIKSDLGAGEECDDQAWTCNRTLGCEYLSEFSLRTKRTCVAPKADLELNESCDNGARHCKEGLYCLEDVCKLPRLVARGATCAPWLGVDCAKGDTCALQDTGLKYQSVCQELRILKVGETCSFTKPTELCEAGTICNIVDYFNTESPLNKCETVVQAKVGEKCDWQLHVCDAAAFSVCINDPKDPKTTVCAQYTVAKEGEACNDNTEGGRIMCDPNAGLWCSGDNGSTCVSTPQIAYANDGMMATTGMPIMARGESLAMGACTAHSDCGPMGKCSCDGARRRLLFGGAGAGASKQCGCI